MISEGFRAYKIRFTHGRKTPHPIESVGRGARIRTGDLLRPRHVITLIDSSLDSIGYRNHLLSLAENFSCNFDYWLAGYAQQTEPTR